MSDNNLRIAQTAPELCRNPLIARYYAPFAGALVPASRYRRDARVQAVLLQRRGRGGRREWACCGLMRGLSPASCA